MVVSPGARKTQREGDDKGQGVLSLLPRAGRLCPHRPSAWPEVTPARAGRALALRPRTQRALRLERVGGDRKSRDARERRKQAAEETERRKEQPPRLGRGKEGAALREGESRPRLGECGAPHASADGGAGPPPLPCLGTCMEWRLRRRSRPGRGQRLFRFVSKFKPHGQPPSPALLLLLLPRPPVPSCSFPCPSLRVLGPAGQSPEQEPVAHSPLLPAAAAGGTRGAGAERGGSARLGRAGAVEDMEVKPPSRAVPGLLRARGAGLAAAGTRAMPAARRRRGAPGPHLGDRGGQAGPFRGPGTLEEDLGAQDQTARGSRVCSWANVGAGAGEARGGGEAGPLSRALRFPVRAQPVQSVAAP